MIFTIFFFLVSHFMYGQLFTISDNYSHNSLAINPAYSGSRDALSATVLYRNNWNGFEGAPKTMSLSVHAPLNNEKIGIGFFIMNDIIGVTNETSLVGSYAYRLNLGYGKLAFGMGFGAIIRNTAWNKLSALDANDDELADNFSSGIMPDFSVGIYYTTGKYFMGISIPLFLSHELDSKTNKYIIKNDFAQYNYFCNAGGTIDLAQSIKLFPSLLVKYQQGNVAQADISTQVILKNKLWLGATYRSRNVLVGMIQCQANRQLRIAYSYDFLVGRNRQFGNNTHEIMLDYVFKYTAKVSGPRQF